MASEMSSEKRNPRRARWAPMPPVFLMTMIASFMVVLAIQPANAIQGLRATLLLRNSGLAEGKAPHNASAGGASLAPALPSPQPRIASVSDPGFAGKRDPFKLPSPSVLRPSVKKDANGDTLPSHLPPGPQGLVINQLKLEGIVSQKEDPHRIAIVSNGAGGAYFLHENEMLYDGTVMRITPQAVYFRERIRVPKGGETFRVVVRELSGTGEGR